MPTMRRNPAGGVIDTTGMGRGAGVVRSPMAMQAFRRGGRVRGYQEGGEVDDDDQQPYQVAQATPDTMRGGGNADVIQDAVTRTLNPPVQEMYERLNPPKGSGSAYQDILNYQSMRNPRVRAAMDEGSQMPEDPGIRARRPPPVQQALRPGQAGAASLQEDSPVVPTLSDRLHGAMSAPFRKRRELGYQEGGYVDDEGLEDQGADDATIDPMAMVSGALNYGKKKYGIPSGDDQEMGFDDGGVVPTQPDQQEGNPNAIDPRQAMAYLAGDGAVSQEIAQALEQRVDPQGQLNPTQRAVAAIGVAPDDEAKFGLIQHYRTKYNGFAGAAKAALARGDMGEAAHQASLAMDSVPNGKRTQFAPAPGGLAMSERPAFGGGGGAPQQSPQQSFQDGGPVEEEDEEAALSRLQPQPQADPPDVPADAPTEDVPVQESLAGPAPMPRLSAPEAPQVLPAQAITQMLDAGFDAQLAKDERNPRIQQQGYTGKSRYGGANPEFTVGKDQSEPFRAPGAGLEGSEVDPTAAGGVVPVSGAPPATSAAPDPRTFAERIQAAPQATLGGVATELGNLAGAAKGVIQRAAPAGSLVRYALGEPYPEEYQAARAVPEGAAAAPAAPGAAVAAPVTAPVTPQGQEQRFRPAPSAARAAPPAPAEGAVIDEDRVNPFTGRVRAPVQGAFGSRQEAARLGGVVPTEEAMAARRPPGGGGARGGGDEGPGFPTYKTYDPRSSAEQMGVIPAAAKPGYQPPTKDSPEVLKPKYRNAQEAALAAHEAVRRQPNNFGNSTGTINVQTDPRSTAKDWLNRGGRAPNEEEAATERAQRRAAAAHPWVGKDASARDAMVASELKSDDALRKEIIKADAALDKQDRINQGWIDRERQRGLNAAEVAEAKNAAAMRREVFKARTKAVLQGESESGKRLRTLVQANPGILSPGNEFELKRQMGPGYNDLGIKTRDDIDAIAETIYGVGSPRAGGAPAAGGADNIAQAAKRGLTTGARAEHLGEDGLIYEYVVTSKGTWRRDPNVAGRSP
jgi:hypothetical protein